MRDLALMTVVTCLWAVACNPDDDKTGQSTPAFCSTFAFSACGGDMIGNWTLQNLCPSLEMNVDQPFNDDPACTTSHTRITVTAFTMHAEFTAASRYTLQFDSSGDMTLNVEQACLDAMAGGPSNLAAFCSQLQSDFATDYPDIACSVTGNTCRCTGTTEMTDAELGTYTVSGNSFTTDPDDPAQNPETIPFCVDGARLSVQPPVDPGDPVYTYVLSRD